LERRKIGTDTPNASKILNTAHKLNVHLLFTISHNTNTRGHPRKLVGNSIKQINGCIFKQQVVTAATRPVEADSGNRSRKGLDQTGDNKTIKTQ